MTYLLKSLKMNSFKLIQVNFFIFNLFLFYKLFTFHMFSKEFGLVRYFRLTEL